MSNALLPALRTDRLVVRLPAVAEAAEVARYHRDNRHRLDASVMTQPASYFRPEAWEARLRGFHEEWAAGRGARFVLATHAAPDVVIGTVGLLGIVRGPFHHCHLGYGLAGEAEGRGYMAEALAEVVRFAFAELHLHRVMANHDVRNERSARLLARLGFHVDGLAPAYVLEDGEWRDSVLTSLVNPAWTPPPS